MAYGGAAPSTTRAAQACAPIGQEQHPPERSVPPLQRATSEWQASSQTSHTKFPRLLSPVRTLQAGSTRGTNKPQPKAQPKAQIVTHCTGGMQAPARAQHGQPSRSLAGPAGAPSRQTHGRQAHVAKRPSRSTAVVPTTTSSLSPISRLYRCRQAGSTPSAHAVNCSSGNQLQQRQPAAMGTGSQLQQRQHVTMCGQRQQQQPTAPHLDNLSSLWIFRKL